MKIKVEKLRGDVRVVLERANEKPVEVRLTEEQVQALLVLFDAARRSVNFSFAMEADR